jgi:multiple sugar transport system substrate-binding protein
MTGVKLLIIAVALVLLVPIRALGETPALQGAEASAPVTVVFWTTEVAPNSRAVIQYLVHAFSARNPDIDIRIRSINENDFAETLQQAQRDGTGPDMISCASSLMVSFHDDGWLDCPGAEALIAGIGRDRFFDGALKALSVDGKQCGLPLNGWIQGIWYRADWFRQHRLAPPSSWDAILRAAKVLHNPAKGCYGILLGTDRDVYAEQVFSQLAHSNNATIFSDDGTIAFDSPATVETLKFYARLARYTPPAPQTWRGRDYYFQGKLAMMFYSTFIMDDFAVPSIAADSLTDDNFPELEGAPFDRRLLENTGMVSTIFERQNSTYGVIHALGLIRICDARRKQAVREFIRFLYTDDAYITWLHMAPGGMLPVLRDIPGNEMFYEDPQGVFRSYSRQRIQNVVTGFNSLNGLESVTGPTLAVSAEITAREIIPDMIKAVLDRSLSPAQAVERAAQQMRALVQADHRHQ